MGRERPCSNYGKITLLEGKRAGRGSGSLPHADDKTGEES
jgi:hypothetical protein